MDAFVTLAAYCDLDLRPPKSNQVINGGLVNIAYKFHQDCSSRSWDIVVTRSVRTNEPTNEHNGRTDDTVGWRTLNENWTRVSLYPLSLSASHIGLSLLGWTCWHLIQRTVNKLPAQTHSVTRALWVVQSVTSALCVVHSAKSSPFATNTVLVACCHLVSVFMVYYFSTKLSHQLLPNICDDIAVKLPSARDDRRR